MKLTVIGADASTWDLLDPTSPVTLTGGIKGLHVPTVSGVWSDTAAGDSRRRRGRVVAPRQVVMKVHVGDLVGTYRDGVDWLPADSAWWTALGGGETPFTLQLDLERLDALGRPDVRHLVLWDESEDDGYDVDPSGPGSQDYVVQASPESPWWAGPTVTARFAYNPVAAANYYGGSTGLGPPFVISAGSQFRNAAIPNPGQRPAWLEYRVIAPFGYAEVGVGAGDRVVPLPFSQVAGQQVVIVTDPRRRSITDGAGTNLWPLLAPGLEPLFDPVPPGASVPLHVRLDDAALGAAVEVSLVPEYRRGW